MKTALMVYFNSKKDPVRSSTVVFAEAMKRFPNEPNIAREYISFLWSINNQQSLILFLPSFSFLPMIALESSTREI